MTDAERGFVEQYPELGGKNALHTDDVAGVSFEVYGDNFERDKASIGALQLMVDNYVDEGFITRRQLKDVKSVTIQGNHSAGTNHVWDGKKSYLNIIVNNNPTGDEKLDFTKTGGRYTVDTDYEWKGCSVNSINTEDAKYYREDNNRGKYITWYFDTFIDLSKANYIVLAFSDANKEVNETKTIIGGEVTEARVENGVAVVQPNGDEGIECLNAESEQANIIKTTASTSYGAVGVVVSKKSVDATLTSETESDRVPASEGTTMYTTVQRYVLATPRSRIVHSVTQNITTVDATGERVSSMVWVLST